MMILRRGNMNEKDEKELFELINPLRTTTWRHSKSYPECNEENYKLYYIAASNIGMISRDSRYPFEVGIYRLIRKQSFPDDYWRTGAKKAITYRSNRIDENINYFLSQCEKKQVINWLFEIYNYDNYQTFGFVKAHSPEEAQQLANLMFGHTIKKVGGTLGMSKKIPLWKSEFQESNKIYTELCLKAIRDIDRTVINRKKSVESLEKEIQDYYLIKDFLNLNMSTFSED